MIETREYPVPLTEEELNELDAPLTLPEGATLTFIRLTFLTGRMW